ncbi:mtTFB1 [Bugula neritina]|uniref:rRNA adenine N(6)-methyltransferase n=1 Tax=Bugula neritina TaxID=10212 RepID=A0A7J7KRA2_BUGNE|nr:mtTFB1 [Bugula neritina]
MPALPATPLRNAAPPPERQPRSNRGVLPAKGLHNMSNPALRLPPIPTIQELIRVYKLGARKRLSQNFLLNQAAIQKLVNCAGDLKGCSVCETLSSAYTYIGKNMRIFHGDVLKFNMTDTFTNVEKRDWHDEPPDVHIIGNLPFNISTPLIILWLRQISQRQGPWSYGRTRLTLTFQKEVGERMVADIMDKQRSRLSIMCQHLCDVKVKHIIPGKVFVPAPKVDVSVVTFTPLRMPRITQPYHIVEKVVRHTFHYRQKYCKRGLE